MSDKRLTAARPIISFSGEYFWLSNFASATITYNNVVFPTTEHAYQAAKTSDLEWFLKIASVHGARQAKFLGRQCPMKPNWDDIKVGVMLDITRLKYEIPRFKQLLLQTGDRNLIEGNYWKDLFWGVDHKTGKGQNMLGRILMHVRQELKEGQKNLWVP